MSRATPMTPTRRAVLGGAAATVSTGLLPRRAHAGGAPYRVGVGQESDPYAATVRAIDACGEWPDVAGKHVIIKPNLVYPDVAQSGVTTDRRVVLAMVDRALADGAAKVTLIEAVNDANFTATGYDAFAAYDPRVEVLNTEDWPHVLVPVPGGSAYDELILPEMLFAPDVVFMSAAKLKTHRTGKVTLTLKNLFGIAPRAPYFDELNPQQIGRFGMHNRSVAQTTVDLNLARPVDFAVIDGIIGMEGLGPRRGDPVRMDVVLAGANALAVDRIGVEVMEMDPRIVPTFFYADRAGLGPDDVSQIDVLGDPLPTRRFALPVFAPAIVVTSPEQVLASGGGTTVSVQFALDRRRPVRASISQVRDDRPWDFHHVASLQAWRWSDIGSHSVSWDGRDASGALVPPGRYAVRIAADDPGVRRPGTGFQWIDVV